MLDLCLVECPNLALETPKMYMPLGNLYLSAMAKQKGYSVHLTDFRAGINELPKARFYGFSCTTPQITVAKQLAKRVKGKTIVGGAHPSLLPDDCKEFDYVVRGEGEYILLDILEGKVKPGVIAAPRIKDLDDLPYPDWDAVEEPFSRTLYTGERYGMGGISMAIIASRGCPWSCSFCGNIYTSVTFRSVDNIIKEIIRLIKRKVNHFRFVDDNFTIHPDFEHLCKELGRYDIKFRCHTRSNLINQKRAELLAQSNCEECSLGIESADDHVLSLNNKKETSESHRRASQVLKNAGVKVKFYWMSGLPGETDKTIELNMQFMKDTQPNKWTLSTFTPYPGCDIFNHPEKFGITIINPDWENWWNFVFNVRNLDLPGRLGYVHVLNGQTPEEMKARHDKFYYWLLEERNWKQYN